MVKCQNFAKFSILCFTLAQSQIYLTLWSRVKNIWLFRLKNQNFLSPNTSWIYLTKKSNIFNRCWLSQIFLTFQKPKFLSPKMSQIYLTWSSIFDFKNLNFKSQTNLTFDQIYLTKLSNMFDILILLQKSQIYLNKVKHIWLF